MVVRDDFYEGVTLERAVEEGLVPDEETGLDLGYSPKVISLNKTNLNKAKEGKLAKIARRFNRDVIKGGLDPIHFTDWILGYIKDADMKGCVFYNGELRQVSTMRDYELVGYANELVEKYVKDE